MMATTATPTTGASKPSATKKIVFTLIATLFPMLVLAVVAEITLRWLEPPVPADAGVIYRPSADAEKGYELVPGSSGMVAGLPVAINSFGCRDRNYSLVKPPGVIRIVGVGDSLTFGQGVKQEHTYLARLEEALASKNLPTEVINCGVGGYNVNEDARRFAEVIGSLDPDIITIGYELGDILQNPRLRKDAPGVAGGGNATGALVERRRLISLLRKSRVLTFLSYRYSFILKRFALRNWDSLYSDESPLWKNLTAKYANMAQSARAKHIDVAVFIIPELSNLNQRYPFTWVHQRVTTMCEAQGIKTIDLLPSFLGQDGPRLWVHPRNRHPNARGHEIIADATLESVAAMVKARIARPGPSAARPGP
jgi:lysophospholipase L1-like esterase